METWRFSSSPVLAMTVPYRMTAVTITFQGKMMLRPGQFVLVLLVLATVLGCAGCFVRTAAPAQPAVAVTGAPCASRASGASPGPAPVYRELAWRTEKMPDGSVRLTVGDVAAAPRASDAVLVLDYRHPGDQLACEQIRVVRVRGWWCITTVRPIRQSGEIVIGGPSRARLHGDGFSTRCSGRKQRMRQLFQIERESWSGWRPYNGMTWTSWTTRQAQAGPAVSAPCPTGRVGTYGYQLVARIQIDDSRLALGGPGGNTIAQYAASPVLRTSCGTGIS